MKFCKIMKEDNISQKYEGKQHYLSDFAKFGCQAKLSCIFHKILRNNEGKQFHETPFSKFFYLILQNFATKQNAKILRNFTKS